VKLNLLCTSRGCGKASGVLNVIARGTDVPTVDFKLIRFRLKETARQP